MMMIDAFNPLRFDEIKTRKEFVQIVCNKQFVKRFEKSNLTNAFNVLYIKKMEIYPAYYSKINSNCGK